MIEDAIESVTELAARLTNKRGKREHVWTDEDRASFSLVVRRVRALAKAKTGEEKRRRYERAWEALSGMGWLLSGRRWKNRWPAGSRSAYRTAMHQIRLLTTESHAG
jgi:hypothetical protein